MGQVSVLDSTGATVTVDNAVVADGTAWVDNTTKHATVGGLYQASPQTVADNTLAPVLLDSKGRQVISPGTAENTTVV